jgi:D-3-phosphoglycerate dehydrogenase
MLNVLITTIPFADKNSLPLELLIGAGANFVINPIGRKLKEEELAELIEDFDCRNRTNYCQCTE